MSQFFLFAGENYYPVGGVHDFVGIFPTLEEAKEAARMTNRGDNWAHVAVVDGNRLKIVAHFGNPRRWVEEGS